MEKRDIINQLLTFEEINNFCNNNKLTEDEIFNNFVVFSKYKESKQSCLNCDGKVCNSQVKGFQSKLLLEDNIVRIIYSECPVVHNMKYGNFEVMNYTNNDIDLEITNARFNLFTHFNRFLDDYINNNKTKGIFLWGSCGTGKSLLLYKFAQGLVNKGVKVLFAYYPDLVREIQSSFGTEHLEDLILKLKKTDIVMIDDIGREANTPYIRDEVLGPVLQYRVDNNLPMFMTSNRNFDLLETHLSETNSFVDPVKARAIISRLKFLMKEYELVDKDFRN